MFFFLGGSLLFATTAHANLAVMLAAPRHLRPLSLAINSVSMHALGDVPSPTLIGALKDALAPHCAVTSVANEMVTFNDGGFDRERKVWQSAGVVSEAFLGGGAGMMDYGESSLTGEDVGEGSWLGISEACRCGSLSLCSPESCTVRFTKNILCNFVNKVKMPRIDFI